MKRAVEMLTNAAPRSELLSLLCEQISVQIRHDIRQIEQEISRMQDGGSTDQDVAGAIQFREGAIRALKGDANRWLVVSKALANAPEGRPVDPDNYAFVGIGNPY